MQTGREAIAALMCHQPADHIPIHDAPWGDTVRKWVRQGMPTDANGNPVSVTEHFGFDMVGCGGWFDWLPKRGVHEVLEETDEWRIVRNGAGAALKWWKHMSGVPEHIDFLMTDRDVWERDYRPLVAEMDPTRFGDAQAIAKNLETWRAKGRWAHYGTQFIWEDMRGSMGDYTMYTALLTDPDWIHDFSRVYTDLYKAGFRYLFENAGLPDGVWLYEDLGYRDRLFCHPKVLDEVIFPYYREMVEFFHSYGVPVVLHSCGYQATALPLIVEAGFDALNPMEVKAGNDIFDFAERYGDRITFVGGLDARILECGDRETIRRGVTDIIRGMKERGARFVYGSDHSLSPNIDYDDFRYSLEVYRSEYAL